MYMANERRYKKKQPQVTDLATVDSWASSDIGEVFDLGFKSLDCFTVRPFFAATHVFVVWNFTRMITTLNFFYSFVFTSVCVCVGGGGGGDTLIWWGTTQLQCIYYLVHYTDL